MKRTLCLLATVFIIVINLSAAYLTFEPVTITQPNGSELSCFASGDEFFNWVHDENNYTIIKNEETGYYCYADLESDNLIPTSYIVGETDPFNSGLTPGIIRIPNSAKEDRKVREDLINSYRSNRASTIGDLNNIVVFIRFADQEEFTNVLSAYDNMFNAEGTNSLYQYYQEVSAQQLAISSTLYPISGTDTVVSYQSSFERAYYQPYDADSNPIGYQGSFSLAEREHGLLSDAVNSVADQIPADLNVDNDEDGYVDNVCFIIQGETGAWADLLWPHMWILYSNDTFINNKQVSIYNFQLSNNLLGNGAGVLCHEMFHSLGAPDLYHYEDDGITSCGEWDLMSSNTNPPHHMTAYMKYKYGGWFDEIPELEITGTYTLDPLAQSPFSCFKIKSPYSTNEFFIVEYRKQEGIFESGLPGNGLIVYRINQTVTGNAFGPPDEVYIYRQGGSSIENGNIDLAFFSEGSGRTAINDDTNPSCFLTNGSLGGLNINNIGTAGITIGFDLNVDITPDFSSSVTQGPASLGVNFVNQSTPLPQIISYEWDFDGDGIYDSSEASPFHLYSEEGIYDVSLKITDLESEVIITKTAYITVTDATAITGAIAGVWSAANSPYTIVDEITVPAGCELVIESGAKVQIESNSWIDVFGKVDVAGTFDDPVDFFTTSQWHGMKIIDSDAENKLIFAKFHNVLGNALIVDNSTLEINNSMFLGGSGNINSTVHLRNGANVEISQTLFMNNESGNSGGALSCEESELLFENNLIVNNSGDAAALKFQNCNPTIIHNTIGANSADSNSGFIIDFINSNAILHNNILWGEDEAFGLNNSFPEISYNCITGGFEGAGNISDDPMFDSPATEAGAGNGNLADHWYLQADSPCIDTGLDEAEYYDISESGMGTELPDMGAFGSMGFPLEYSVNVPEGELVPQLQTSMKIYPNPFNPTTNIMLNLSDQDRDNPVSLKVFNLKGQLVKTVLNNEITAERSYSWNGRDNSDNSTASGIYFVQLKTATEVTTSKILLMK